MTSTSTFSRPAIRPAAPTVNEVTALLQCSNLGGMEQVAYALFEQLQAEGISLRVVTPRPWGKGQTRLLKVDPTARAFNYRGKFGWRSFPQFRRGVETMKRSSRHVWVIGTCASCLMAARLSGRKTLLSHHYHHFEGRTSWLKWMTFYLGFGPGLAAITYPTEFTRNEALRIAPWLEGKTHVVRNGFDVNYSTEEQRLAARQAARLAMGMPQDAFIIGNAGWLIRRKRFDVFLRTAQVVAGRVPSARFYICGGGPEEKPLRQLAVDLGIADKVHFAGWVSDMSVYYQAWDALLFNTDFDALGNTPLEAASYGCPSVASCCYGGLSEFLEDGRTGYLFENHEPGPLADRLVQLAVEPALALDLRLRAVEKLKREFSSAAAIRFYQNYFQREA